MNQSMCIFIKYRNELFAVTFVFFIKGMVVYVLVKWNGTVRLLTEPHNSFVNVCLKCLIRTVFMCVTSVV